MERSLPLKRKQRPSKNDRSTSIPAVRLYATILRAAGPGEVVRFFHKGAACFSRAVAFGGPLPAFVRLVT